MHAFSEIVSFTSTTPGRSSGVRQKHYAQCDIVNVSSKRLSVRVLDDTTQHTWWRDEDVGKIKVIALDRVIPDLAQ
ncbi:hypothetical protein [Burkholderia territorii]|uniref:hypothetical protein n=1 Tax=Burkholderia territorii TaxID=1503055 RepID=UPI000A4C17FB|nr:hypothetical protein [Burkholderia territorii]